MSDVVELAEAVAAELADYHAEVLFCPEFELREIEEMKVVVVPLAVEYKTVSRAAHEEVLKVQIGFLGKTLADAMCIGVAYNPIYFPEHFRERRQFTSVIELSFKKFR